MSGLLSQLHFLRPQWFWALLALPLLAAWWLWQRRRASVWRAHVDPHLLPHLVEGGVSRRGVGGLLARLLAWTLAVAALAGPSWRQGEVPLQQHGRALVVVLDLSDAMLARLDVVVASVHSKLRMEKSAMTHRMVAAVASPHVDILGHCTGRMIGKRPPSEFDADYVFAACAQFGTAVEINCRPERLDPPRELLDLAVEYGCWFSIDSDAHSTGQLEWQPHGCDRAADRGVPIDRIINTMPAADLLQWCER